MLALIVLMIAALSWRYWPKSPQKLVDTAPIVASAAAAPDSSAYYKAKYDSLYKVWTEARERIFTKRKYKQLNKRHEQADSLGAF